LCHRRFHSCTGVARAAEQLRCSDQGSDQSSTLKTVALVVPAFDRLALTARQRTRMPHCWRCTNIVIGEHEASPDDTSTRARDAIGRKNTHIAQGMRASGFRHCMPPHSDLPASTPSTVGHTEYLVTRLITRSSQRTPCLPARREISTCARCNGSRSALRIHSPADVGTIDSGGSPAAPSVRQCSTFPSFGRAASVDQSQTHDHAIRCEAAGTETAPPFF
jgi:hypothetical protein